MEAKTKKEIYNIFDEVIAVPDNEKHNNLFRYHKPIYAVVGDNGTYTKVYGYFGNAIAITVGKDSFGTHVMRPEFWNKIAGAIQENPDHCLTKKKILTDRCVEHLCKETLEYIDDYLWMI